MPGPTPQYSVIDVGSSLAGSSFISVPGNSYDLPSPGALTNKVCGFFPDRVSLDGNASWRASLISLLESFLLYPGSLQDQLAWPQIHGKGLVVHSGSCPGNRAWPQQLAGQSGDAGDPNLLRRLTGLSLPCSVMKNAQKLISTWAKPTWLWRTTVW